MPSSRALVSTLALGALLCSASPALADDPKPAQPPRRYGPLADPPPKYVRPPDWTWAGMLDIRSFSSFAWWAGGALSGLALHEMGHILTNLAYGNVPAFTGILYGKFFPWFVVNPRISCRHEVCYKNDGSVFGGGMKGYYLINTAGFHVQNLGSEIILGLHPGLLYERAPFIKGMFWMNTILSIGYATAAMLNTEDPHGDLYGAAQHSIYPHRFVAAIVMANGGFDLLRYFFPNEDWIPWISRTSKFMLLGIDIPFK